MKKLLIPMYCLFALTLQAQQERGVIGQNNWVSGWTDFKPNKSDKLETTKVLFGKITSDYTLSNSNVYLLQGKVYVTNNAVLTIEPGTIIRGDNETVGALIITKGAKIVAEGTPTNPIVFTSNKPTNERKAADWGGIVILGDAPINFFGGSSNINFDLDIAMSTYGGTNLESNSGSLKYVRVEFAGKSNPGFKEFNGITFAGVGNKTKIENVQVSVSGDDSFEFFGGNFTANNLVSYRAKDDDYDFTQGAQITLNNAMAIRNAFISSNEGSRCFEVESYDKKESADFSKKLTNVIANNITFVNESDDGSDNGLVREALFINNGAALQLKNSVISGFSPAVLIGKSIEVNEENLKKINLQNLLINNCVGNIVSEQGGVYNEDLETYYASVRFGNLYTKTPMVEMFIDTQNAKTPDYRLKIGAIN